MTETHGLLEELWRAAPKPDFEQNRPLLKLETSSTRWRCATSATRTRTPPADKEPSQ